MSKLKTLLSIAIIAGIMSGCAADGIVKEYNYTMEYIDSDDLIFQTRLLGKYKEITPSLAEVTSPYEILISAKSKYGMEYLGCNFLIKDVNITSDDKNFTKNITINKNIRFTKYNTDEINAIYLSKPMIDIPYQIYNININYEITQCGFKNKSGDIKSRNNLEYEEYETRGLWDMLMSV